MTVKVCPINKMEYCRSDCEFWIEGNSSKCCYTEMTSGVAHISKQLNQLNKNLEGIERALDKIARKK